MQNDSPVYKARREKMAQWMQGEGVDLVMFSDFEEGRDCAVRWLSGMPQDALYFLDKNGRSVLMPWDINMAAECKACAELIFPYNEVSRSSILAMKAAASYLKLKHGAKVEIPSSTPYYKFLQYVDEAGEYDIRCRKEGAQQESARLRAVKDDAEIAIIMEGSAITNEIIALVENGVKIGELKTEVDVALFIDREGRKRGCEGMGFETLAAGPKRSFGIHAFPSFTGGEFGTEGLSLVDFGLIH
jgi:Xaa-Pro dipeptidase